MPSIRTYIQQKIREVESWLELPPDETDWEQVALDCRTVLGEVEQQATLAGVPDAVAACQVQGSMIPVGRTRRILAECLAACPPDDEQEPVLLTVKQAAAQYTTVQHGRADPVSTARTRRPAEPRSRYVQANQAG